MRENVNHYKANSEFRYLFNDMIDHGDELKAFFQHFQQFIDKKETDLHNLKQIYSEEFFDLFFVQGYGETFRRSQLIALGAVAEGYVKRFIEIWLNVLNLKLDDINQKQGILPNLHKLNEQYFQLPINWQATSIEDFRNFLAVRNSFVHSGGTLKHVTRYKPYIAKFIEKFNSVELDDRSDDWETGDEYKVLFTNDKIYDDILMIAGKFISYLLKLSIRQFPNFRSDIPPDDDWEWEIP